jgi:hypothetical protein
MSNAAAEAPASYVLATEFHDLVEEMSDTLGREHLHLALELRACTERIVGNVGAAEAPYAVARRQSHYQMAFAAACGCAAVCDLVLRLRLAPVDQARRATRLLRSLASTIQPIAEEGMEPRSELEEAIMGEVFGDAGGTEPWRTDDDPDDDEDDHGRAW